VRDERIDVPIEPAFKAGAVTSRRLPCEQGLLAAMMTRLQTIREGMCPPASAAL